LLRYSSSFFSLKFHSAEVLLTQRLKMGECLRRL
jgi:hypothetical protein